MKQHSWISADMEDGDLIVFRADKITAIGRVEDEGQHTLVFLDGYEEPFCIENEFGEFFAKVTQAHLPLV